MTALPARKESTGAPASLTNVAHVFLDVHKKTLHCLNERARQLQSERFPLTPADFKSVTDLRIQAAGAGFVATLREGSDPSPQDRAALRQIITSIRFPRLRVGTFAPSGEYWTIA